VVVRVDLHPTSPPAVQPATHDVRAPASLGGTEGNSRLTGTTAAILLVLLAAEGLTLLSLHSFLSWHIFIGMLLVPIVALKLASTGYRLATTRATAPMSTPGRPRPSYGCSVPWWSRPLSASSAPG
jgi:hypothetical protein